MSKNELEKVKEKVAIEAKITDVIKDEVADVSLKTVAKIKARYLSYEKIFGNYEKFVEYIAGQLAGNKYADNTFKEMGCARIVANWLADTEGFLEANENILAGVEKVARKGFVKQSLAGLPDDLRQDLLDNLNEKKAELLEQFAKDIQIALQTARDRKK